MNHTWWGTYEARCGRAHPGDALADRREDAACRECLSIPDGYGTLAGADGRPVPEGLHNQETLSLGRTAGRTAP